jgi:hypothetical protein
MQASRIKDQVAENDDTPIWGADQIGKLINRNARQTHHLLTTGAIKCAQKKGGRWCAIPSALRREFGAAS